MECKNHPGTETVLRCNKCESPICGRCVIFTPVGGRCKECARLQRLPQYQVGASYLARGIGVALLVGLSLGLALGFIGDLGVVPFRLRGLFYTLELTGIGYLVGQGVSAATNRKQGPVFQGIAVGGFLLGFLTFALVVPGFFLGFSTLIGLMIGIALALNPSRR